MNDLSEFLTAAFRESDDEENPEVDAFDYVPLQKGKAKKLTKA